MITLTNPVAKGNQLKFELNNVWYKADCLGYEGLIECLVSSLLQKTNIDNFTIYKPACISYENQMSFGCKSQNFIPENYRLLTIDELFTQELNLDVSKYIASMDIKDKIQFVVDNVKQLTGLNNFGQYLSKMLAMDAFFLNEDRHFNNIAVLYNIETKQYDYCPIFDNGACLFSDTFLNFPLENTIEQCYKDIQAKPFSISFDEQLDAVEELYGSQFKISFTRQDIQNELDKLKAEFGTTYDDAVYTRVEHTALEQLRKYTYMKDKTLNQINLQPEMNNHDSIELA